MTNGTNRVTPVDVSPPEGESNIQGRKLLEDAVLLIPNIVKLIGRLLIQIYTLRLYIRTKLPFLIVTFIPC